MTQPLSNIAVHRSVQSDLSGPLVAILYASFFYHLLIMHLVYFLIWQRSPNAQRVQDATRAAQSTLAAKQFLLHSDPSSMSSYTLQPPHDITVSLFARLH